MEVNETEFREIKSELKELEKRVSIVEKDQTETKVYVKQIFGILDELKLAIRNGLTKDDLKEFMQMQNDQNNKTLATWQKWVLIFLGATLFLVISYFFTI